MPTQKEITDFLNETLRVSDFSKDYSNNGLQVEGKEVVKTAIFAVDASVELFEKTIEADADYIIVHHGISWGNSLNRITGQNAMRVKPLIQNDISLYAAHLPLDAHEELGHNAQLADYINLKDQQMFSEYSGKEIGVRGTLPNEETPLSIAKKLAEKLNGDYKVFGDQERRIKTVGIISGGGTDGIPDAVELGLDCFITGEVKHEVFHTIKELDIPVIALGHYCSEKPGLFAVMELLSEKFDIDCKFIDIPTGL